MAKYSFEFKKKVIEAYQRGEGGYSYLAEKYGVKNRRQVLNWVHYYEKFGDKGLMCSRKNNSYTFKYKLHVVELYLSSEVS
ncbi:helix-turn-helix domain-containing protein, partial [Clostridium coskatii]